MRNSWNFQTYLWYTFKDWWAWISADNSVITYTGVDFCDTALKNSSSPKAAICASIYAALSNAGMAALNHVFAAVDFVKDKMEENLVQMIS